MSKSALFATTASNGPITITIGSYGTAYGVPDGVTANQDISDITMIPRNRHERRIAAAKKRRQRW